jgi:hypothetical protein
MNWSLTIALLIALGGGMYFLSRPLGPNAYDAEYRRHLSAAEKSALSRGETVSKNHRAKTNIWKSGYREGPLKIVPQADGKLTFTPYGRWQYFSKGHLFSDHNYMGPHRTTGHLYNDAGEVIDVIQVFPIVLDGDSATETRVIYLDVYRLTDTLVVNHVFESFTGRPVKKEFWSFDAQGKRPVPPNWKFHRY